MSYYCICGAERDVKFVTLNQLLVTEAVASLEQVFLEVSQQCLNLLNFLVLILAFRKAYVFNLEVFSNLGICYAVFSRSYVHLRL